VAEISTASVEQSEGVTQIGQAVTQMDEATQQNAALVEENAAAAESLREQAKQLVYAVAAFRLDGTEPDNIVASGALTCATQPVGCGPARQPAPSRLPSSPATASADQKNQRTHEPAWDIH
jgi:methyl-accepting chemotaxis protein